MSEVYALVSQLALVLIISFPFTHGGYELSISGQNFTGDKIVIFYERRFGLCPYYNNSDKNQPVNGGLPQNANLTAHLAAVEKQINETIPNRCFRGAAVIDLEEWRPYFNMNWNLKEVYRWQSLRLVQKNHPNLTLNQAWAQAAKEFNEAARKFFVSTLETARRLRPYARWGYYDYPYCNVDAGLKANDYSCSKEARRLNDLLYFVYEASTGLFPSIYLKGSRTAEQSSRFVQAVLAETRRVATMAPNRRNIFVYTKFEYNPYNASDWFYNKSDLCNTVKLPLELGARGLVIWSTSKNMKSRCRGIADYIDQHYGPYLQHTRKQALDCRRSKCSGNGNCVLSKTVAQCNMEFTPKENYVCMCDEGYYGDDCSHS